ncbi:hypothetical protein ES288_D01G258100v1 [Gossypium darwinii]|uniref:Uncharacterized protein n=1 Tax=Gossypium darwinii TaxID=34276 RepID=A0A5D2DUE4_GOSDA|nr:hypothetical protein ES288_D01G258100v1 [Gossypium darwinii]
MSCREDYSILLLKRIKAKKKLKKLAKMRAETARLANLAERRHRRMVEAREAIRPLIIAAASLNAQANQFISAWLDRNDCL